MKRPDVFSSLYILSACCLGVAHSYDIYEGDHGSRVGERWETHVMPFFSEHLDAE